MTDASFPSRITRLPIAHEPAPAEDAAQLFADMETILRDLLAGAAGCSPFLHDVMRQDSAWLRVALTLSPETVVSVLLRTMADAAGDALGPALRIAKRRLSLITALADLGGVWSLEQVTGALTTLADRATDLAIKSLIAEELRRGKLPGQTIEDLPVAAGMVVLAMGKMGARELNYSSDIDLICLFDDARYGDEAPEARAAFVRVTRKLAALMSEKTADGYVFRTDLRLRPDASVTPVCLSMSAAESYYESHGRTWERAAYIKARPCAGDIAAGQQFLATLRPFVWRKHLDFAAIQDAHDMRLRIRDHRGLHGKITLEGHNMKLGVGGIREIEFFTQTRQLIAGGRDPELRDPTTIGGLAALAERGWVPQDVARDLTSLYRAHREVEHRLQMVSDAQTHSMPPTAEGIARIAHMSGASDVDAWRAALFERLARTERLTDSFFAPGAVEPVPDISAHAKATMAGWTAYPALRSDRAQAIFQRLRPGLLRSLEAAANPDEALTNLDGFLAGLPAGVQIFSLFDANPQLVSLIVDIAATTPVLARYLARNSSVLDAVLGGSFFSDWPGAGGLTGLLDGVLRSVGDYEGKLDAARRWMKEWHFRIGVHHLRGLIQSDEAGRQYADLASAVVAGLWPAVGQEFARKHGSAPGRGAVVLGMGSLGAGQLNAGSDLDLIVIYDAQGVEQSDGPRPLATRAYYARLTQALVTALQAPMAEGRLYEVDMRLRPSGRQGPVATSVESFRNYQMTEAWTWEHLALTRARVIAGPDDVAAEVEVFRREVLTAKGQGSSVVRDVAAMRQRLMEARPGGADLDVKLGPGRLMDIELMAETAALQSGDPAQQVGAQLQAGVAAAILSQTDATVLQEAYTLCWQVQAALRLLMDEVPAPDRIGTGGQAFLLRQTGDGDMAGLIERLQASSARAAGVIDRLLDTAAGEGG